MRSLNGQLLKEMLISAANNLYNHYPEIDALNVFPVPDGDTGMNMNLTLTSGAKEIQNRNDDDAYAIVNTFSRGLLMGARGNSGVITSQIFRGFASSLKEKKTVDVLELADAFLNGSKTAYKAVMKPVEGTILTVIRESSEALSSYVTEKLSIEKAFEYLIKEAKSSLARTPELLPVLKEVGVVDSGGAGLVVIFEGMYLALINKFVEKNTATTLKKPKTEPSEDYPVDSGYEVSLTLLVGEGEEKKLFIPERFKTVLENRGKLIECNIEGNAAKIKVLTKSPGALLTYIQGYGEYIDIEIKNLDTKLSVEASKEEVKPAIKKVPEKEFALVSVCAGKGVEDYFSELGVDKIVSGGQTMNPSIEDIISAIRGCNAKTVFVLPNNSNIVMAAIQAADVLSGEIDVRVVTTKTIPQGIIAASTFNPDASADENEKEMKSASKNIKSGSITYAIKDTTVDGIEVTKDYFMGILDKSIVLCEKHKNNALKKLLKQMITDESYLVTLFFGEDIEANDKEKLMKDLVKQFPNVEFDFKDGLQPVYSFLVGVE